MGLPNYQMLIVMISGADFFSLLFSITLTILQYKLKSVGLPTDRPTLLHTQHIYYTTFVKAISIHNMHE